MSSDPSLEPFRPLIPLPPSRTPEPPSSTSSERQLPISPFSSLFSVDPLSSASNQRPLFPVNTTSHPSRTPQPPPISSLSQDSPSTPGFGDFVSADPLQQSSVGFSPLASPLARFKPVTSNQDGPSHDEDSVPPGGEADLIGLSSDVRDSARAFGGNAFIEEAKLRAKGREQKVLGELLDNQDDPLYFFRDGSAPARAPASGKADGLAGLSLLDLLDTDDPMYLEKQTELEDEVAQHAVLPSTPRASRSGSPQPMVNYRETEDGDIINLVTGKRESTRSRERLNDAASADATHAVGIRSRGHHSGGHSPQVSQSPPLSSSSPYLSLSRKWSSFLSSSLPQTEPLRQEVNRQESSGEFTALPHPTFRVGSHPQLSSPTPSGHSAASTGHDTPPGSGSATASSSKLKTPARPPLKELFESTPSTLSSPFAKKFFIPATGAPGFRPDDNWNPGNFEYDTKSSSDILGHGVELTGRTSHTIKVLSSGVADQLRGHLPALPRLAQKWKLLYSTDQHGISITTFYKKVEQAYGTGGGVILAVREEDEEESGCFGVYVGGGIKWNEGAYYGSGESFLWKTVPGRQHQAGGSPSLLEVKVFKWTGMNDYVALCEGSYISFGGGDGKYGLYIDSSFLDGSSERCPTFNNDVLCSHDGNGGDGRRRFECIAVEAWGVGGP